MEEKKSEVRYTATCHMTFVVAPRALTRARDYCDHNEPHPLHIRSLKSGRVRVVTCQRSCDAAKLTRALRAVTT